MGPLRRQLILFMVTATPAMAEVCDKSRPGWSPDHGPVTALGEALVFAATPAALLLLAGVGVGWYLRQQLLLTAVVMASLVFAIPRIWPVNPDLTAAARAEGCMGPPTLVIGLLGLIWLGAMAGLLLRRKGVT
jgi:hypothetical protein